MRRFTGLALVALASALTGALAASVRTASAAPPPAVEHKVVLVDFEEFKEEPEYKALEKELKTPWRAQFAYHERILNRAAEAGYELVQVTTPNPKLPSQAVLYLRKRP